jgi:hypothetical protein
MKFTQEEIKKILLIAVVLLGLLYFYYDVLLGGISANETKKNALINEIQPKIKQAREQLARTKELERKAGEVDETLDQIKALIPPGAPIAWFPPRIAEFLKRQGIEKASTRPNEEITDKDLGGFCKKTWTIELPKVAFPKLGIAIAGVENEEPLLEIFKIHIEETLDDPLAQNATLNVVTIVTKQ